MGTSFVQPLAGISNALMIPQPTSYEEATPGASLVPISTLDQRNATHQLYNELWRNIEALYAGGAALKVQAERFLLKRPKEVTDIYAVRLQGFTYHNLMQLGVGYYGAKLFEDDPEIDIKVSGQALKPPAEGPAGDAKAEQKIENPSDETWDFYVEQFMKDCDGNRTTFPNFAREVVKYMLLYQSAFVLMDLPAGTQKAETLAEQNLRPYLKLYAPSQVINYDVDDRGNLNWIVIRIETVKRAFLKKPVKVVQWHYFDRKEFINYEWSEDDKRPENATQDAARLVDRGPHSMSDYMDSETGQVTGRVPVEMWTVKEDFWIANRVYLAVLDHLNIDNTYSFALKQGNLAMPVITSDTEYQPQLSECGFIMLPPGSDFKWAEPSGTSYKQSQERIDRLREEIFRLMHLQAQGKSSTATASAQSGYSKEQDLAPAHDVLESLGNIVRAYMQITLYLVAAVRKDEAMDFDVRGFDFEDQEVIPEIEAVAAMQALNVRSEKFAKEIEKALIRAYGRDWNPELVKECEAEVDAAPTLAEIDAAQQQQEQQQMIQRMQASSSRLLNKPPSD